MSEEWVKVEFAGRMRYFRRESLNKLYDYVSRLVGTCEPVRDPEEIRRAKQLERGRPKYLTEQDIVERAAAKELGAAHS